MISKDISEYAVENSYCNFLVMVVSNELDFIYSITTQMMAKLSAKIIKMKQS